MPGENDLQNLAQELGATVQPVTDPAPLDAVAPTDPVLETKTPEADATKVVENKLEEDKQSRAFAEMRAKISKYEKAFKRLKENNGAESEDEILEKLLEDSTTEAAKKQNIDPALLKRMQDIEEQNQMLMMERHQTYIRDSFNNLQKTENLKDDELISFAEQLQEKGINLLDSNIDLVALYRGMNYDNILQKKIDAAKQDWIKSEQDAKNAPGVNNTTGKKPEEGKKEISTMSELDAVLKTLK